jgi:hypothetical protein
MTAGRCLEIGLGNTPAQAHNPVSKFIMEVRAKGSKNDSDGKRFVIGILLKEASLQLATRDCEGHGFSSYPRSKTLDQRLEWRLPLTAKSPEGIASHGSLVR